MEIVLGCDNLSDGSVALTAGVLRSYLHPK